MTISVAWVRRVGRAEELVFASDSKLTGGEEWVGCPKVFPLSRGDCALSFAGDTYYAYPAVTQVVAALESYRPIREREIDIPVVAGHIVRLLNGMLDRRECPDVPGTRLLFGGYSWSHGEFKLYTIEYSEERGQFWLPGLRKRRGGAIAWIGDPADAHEAYRQGLVRAGLLTREGGQRPFNWEPFVILRDIIRSGQYRAVGGPPQVVKVYRHATTKIFAVYWRDAVGVEDLTIRGRYALHYELPDLPTLDCDTFEVFSALGRHHMTRQRTRLIHLLRRRCERLDE